MLAIVSAMSEEISHVIDALTDVEIQERGRRRFCRGWFQDVELVAVYSRIGKVAAASTVTQMLATYDIDQVIFTGMAGGVRPGLAIGDIVVGTRLIQHDMDASPLFPRYEIPLLGESLFAADADLNARLGRAAHEFLTHDLTSMVPRTELEFFNMHSPQAVPGLIASGDKFFASAAEADQLRRALPEIACVEMEGAAVAQVCAEYEIPLGVVRTISDSANESSVHDFPRFAREIARHYSLGILSRYLAT